MKIAYILDDDISQTTGIVKKIKSKTDIWNKLGHEVLVISLRSKGLNAVIDNGIIISELNHEKNIVQKFFQQQKNMKILNKYLFKFKPDIIYVRYMKYYPNMVEVLKRHAPFVVEINSNDVEEQKRNNKIVYLYNLFTRKVLLQNASAFVSVSHELNKNSNFAKFNKRSIVIGNGYNFNNILIESKNNNKLEFVFVGTPGQQWHGLDKVIYLANKLNNHIFHIVGPSKKDAILEGYNANKNIVLHGYCNPKLTENIIKKCDIGISTLALHRKNMNEASPLKSREYLALGLPIIVGYKDTDLPENLDFVLNVGNYEDNIRNNITKIVNFMKSIETMKPNNIIRESREYLDYQEKEKVRLLFLENIYNKER